MKESGSAHLTEGQGHDRSMGNIGMVMGGGMLVVNSYILRYFFPLQPFASELSAIIGAGILALPIIWFAIKDLLCGKVYMNELAALAILAALAGADFRTAGLIGFFLLLTVIIESHTASGARRSIEALVKLTPRTARKLVDGTETEVDASTLALGDLIRLRPGDNFPVDGVVQQGESTVNQASITGESLPVEKNVGADVFAGTQNLTGSLEVKVTRLGEETTLGRVRRMLLSAENNQTPLVRVIDHYAAFYTPTILMLAALTWWLSGGDMKRVITLLIIACPCVILLATSTAVVAAVAAAARLGILVKNVAHLELAARIGNFVFDKTGTLTDGLLSVAKLVPADGVTAAELLRIAAAAEQHSTHPLAMALMKLAGEVDIVPGRPDRFMETPGQGVMAVIDGVTYHMGRVGWLKNQNIDMAAVTESDADMSVIHVARSGSWIGWIGFKDKLRGEASEMVSELKQLGVKRCSMITGDRRDVAAKIASQLGLDEWRAECLPEGKVEYIKNTRQNIVTAMVGDGINDAPALASADLGIAMGAIGSDIAINSASIALMTNDLRRIPRLLELSRKLRIVIGQNLFLSMLFVFGGMILSVFGQLTPVMAALLHSLAVILIIFNSARLVRLGDCWLWEQKTASCTK